MGSAHSTTPGSRSLGIKDNRESNLYYCCNKVETFFKQEAVDQFLKVEMCDFRDMDGVGSLFGPILVDIFHREEDWVHKGVKMTFAGNQGYVPYFIELGGFYNKESGDIIQEVYCYCSTCRKKVKSGQVPASKASHQFVNKHLLVAALKDYLTFFSTYNLFKQNCQTLAWFILYIHGAPAINVCRTSDIPNNVKELGDVWAKRIQQAKTNYDEKVVRDKEIALQHSQRQKEMLEKSKKEEEAASPEKRADSIDLKATCQLVQGEHDDRYRRNLRLAIGMSLIGGIIYKIWKKR